MKLTVSIIYFISLPLFLFSQDISKSKIWSPFEAFIGTWKGNAKNGDEIGTEEISFKQIFEGSFIEVKCKVDYKPNDFHKKGWTEQSIGYISYDRYWKTYAYREFHNQTASIGQFRLMNEISIDEPFLDFASQTKENFWDKNIDAKVFFKISSKKELIHKTQTKRNDVVSDTFSTSLESKLIKQ